MLCLLGHRLSLAYARRPTRGRYQPACRKPVPEAPEKTSATVICFTSCPIDPL
jgi:hypothetical protein